MFTLLRSLLPDRHPLRLLWHKAKAALAALWYGFPARNLIIIGITGTDGKTTTVAMITHILREQGLRVGTMSTASFDIAGTLQENPTQKTSPSPFLVQRFLRDCVRANCTHVVMEYSSHGIVQHRLDFTWPTVAAITNISPEHLDYHGSMDQYRKDKERIFGMMREGGVKVLSAQCSVLSSQIDLSIPGEFNKDNAKTAIACSMAIGIDERKAIDSLKTFLGVPGRMEEIDEGQKFRVFIDFTVTPEAYRKTLRAARELLGEGKRLLVLTGSCGDRMKEKRPTVGRICSDLADVVVVSNEDPYTEDPEQIIEDVWIGIDQSQTEAHKIPDRREAIVFLLKNAQQGDIVLFCGKGSDTTMWVKEGRIPWDERRIIRELLVDF